MYLSPKKKSNKEHPILSTYIILFLTVHYLIAFSLDETPQIYQQFYLDQCKSHSVRASKPVMYVGIWLLDKAGDSKVLGTSGSWAIPLSFARRLILQCGLEISSNRDNKATRTIWLKQVIN